MTTIARDVYARRLAVMRDRLSTLSADGLFATPSSNLFYSTGIDFHRSERLTALFLFKDRDPFVVCPAFEAARLKGMSAVAEVHTWEETEDAFARAERLGVMLEDFLGCPRHVLSLGGEGRSWLVSLLQP